MPNCCNCYANDKRRFRRTDEILEVVKSVAQQCNDVTMKHGCVIVDSKGKILGTGVNYSFGGYIQHGRFTEHAETAAIKSAIRKHGSKALIGAKLFVIKVTNAGNVRPSNPCEQCTYHIQRAGIKSVYFNYRDETTEPIRRKTSDIVEQCRHLPNYKKICFANTTIISGKPIQMSVPA